MFSNVFMDTLIRFQELYPVGICVSLYIITLYNEIPLCWDINIFILAAISLFVKLTHYSRMSLNQFCNPVI